MRLPATEFESRTARLLEYVKQEQLAGVVLFDNFHIT